MSLIIHGVNKVGDVRILFEGDLPEEDGLLEVELSTLRFKAYLVDNIRKKYPEVIKMLLGNNSTPYYQSVKPKKL